MMSVLSSLQNFQVKNFLIRLGLVFIVCGLFSQHIYRDMASHGIILLALLGIVELFQKKKSLKELFTSSSFTPFLIIYFLFLFSLAFTSSENTKEIYHYFEKRLTFLALPIAFIALPKFENKRYQEVFFLFFLIVLLTSLASSFYYIQNREAIIESYGSSGVLPTPIHHVRYSLMICYSIIIGIFLLDYTRNNLFSVKNILLITGTLFLTLYLHLLAVRSGLLGFYIIAFIYIIYLILNKNYKLLIGLLCGCVILLFIAFNHIETFKKRLGYTLYDIEKSSIKESANNYSLSRRFVSNKVGYEVFQSNLIFGTGEADLQTEMHKVYQNNYPYIERVNYLDPHNQYLTILAGTGIIGFIIFMVCFYYPLFKNKNYTFLPLWGIYLILTVSFFAEDTLQTQIGFIFGLFFIMLNLHWLKEKKNQVL